MDNYSGNKEYNIYRDIRNRTNGEIYLGVVGPVRTGKSTFIKRFMETQVLPNIENDYRRERARDELPQSGSGRTIMTQNLFRSRRQRSGFLLSRWKKNH